MRKEQKIGFIKGLGITMASDFSKLTLETRRKKIEMPSNPWENSFKRENIRNSHIQLNSQSNVNIIIKTTSAMQHLKIFASCLLLGRIQVYQKKGVNIVGGRSGVCETGILNKRAGCRERRVSEKVRRVSEKGDNGIKVDVKERKWDRYNIIQPNHGAIYITLV